VRLKFDVSTFVWLWQLSTLGDLDWLLWSVAWESLCGFNLGDNVHSLENLTEDYVLAIEPAVAKISIGMKVKVGLSKPGNDGSDEKLRAVGVLSSIGHT
jgi:hypothetical protein